MVFGVVPCGDIADVRCFVEAAPGEGNGKRFHARSAQFPGVMKDRGRIHTAAQPNSQGHVGEQVIANGLAQEIVELFLRAFQGLLLLGLEAQAPIRFDLEVSVLPFQQVSRREFLDAAHQRVRAGNIVQREVILQAGEIQLARKFRMSENGFQFRAEIQLSATQVKIQRLDSETIARENQSPGILRPNRERKNAAKAREAILVPAQKSAQNYFGVAVGFEFFAARFQFRAQFAVVVDLTVEDQYGVSVLADHWLIARLKIDDLEAHGTQRNERRFIRALLVRTAMN